MKTKLLIIFLIIGAVGIASLTNVIVLNLQALGFFIIDKVPCSCIDENGIATEPCPSDGIVEEVCEAVSPSSLSSSEPGGTYEEDYYGEGCGVGFWKNHAEVDSQASYAWPAGYNPDHPFIAFFQMPITISSGSDPTLLEALNAKGGGINDLARQAVAALLNAAHPDVEYKYSEDEVIQLTQQAIIDEDYEIVEEFEEYNALHHTPLCSNYVEEETEETTDTDDSYDSSYDDDTETDSNTNNDNNGKGKGKNK